MTQQEPIDFSEEHARQVLRDHITMIAKRSVEKHGHATTMRVMEAVLDDRDVIRRDVAWKLDTALLQAGEFAAAVPSEEGYVIALHDWFEGKQEVMPVVIAYHLATVNYGEHVVETAEAELFGASLLGLDIDAFYEQICSIANDWENK
ncbi:MAG: hypothetical protein ISR75_06645 [Phycisphaerales bacterium]|nr:hypothetical protein [Planctomycetota bacterium]MBL6998097.1 hypothetical protein [Phycisphaerales bacterium]